MEMDVYLDDALKRFAKVTPDAAAIRILGRVTTYAEFDNHVAQIARAMTDRGVGPRDRVVICSVKSVETIASIYAILRVGGIYVPIDPAAPAERVSAQLSAASPKMILADTARLPKFTDAAPKDQLLDISQPLPSDPRDLPVVKRNPEDPAYILMTSGTTGTPKGIVHTHKSGLAYAKMAADLCGLRPSDRVSHHTPVHFDMSIFDIFSTAQAGACAVVIPEMHAKLPASLSELTEQEKITVWYSVPYALIQMAERGVLDSRDLSALRVVMFAGEKMPPAALKAFSQHTPNATFLNAYGPTETNHCTTAKLTHADLDGTSPIPIGRPDAGVTARIGTEAEDAETGELLIAADQVMLEYWRAQTLTDVSFCTLPDEHGITRKFYRTGDIVRRLPEKGLLLIGRKDRQIKLRGFRIELDEIELALVNTPTVTEAVAAVVDDEIHAFVTGGTSEDVADVRSHIEGVLPRYAVPQHITWLADMPRTSTGKIDRAKLTGKDDAQHAA
ncbi:amino acid adenylation domain-containing protein [Ruegeria sp. R14_0]|uniref:amino acid adenylation domain-containing protein n=1 Tax=Ruegeria sp. R14_0 TaxID=2821100 RepID=UPI001ADC5EB0|nr:amino acid adenylation domain-containing protein [Ruegeria sp. R14_0]MBO9446350.1 amino acid adenylation domain-containing protein [Ruegeria sp. R14_0]